MKFKDFKNTPLFNDPSKLKEIFIESAYNLHDFGVVIKGARVILKTNSTFNEV